MIDPRILASRIWADLYRRREKPLPSATYLDYDADTGRHRARTRNGIQPIERVITNAGLQIGQAIELRDGVADAPPRTRPKPRRSPVIQIEEPLVKWAILLRRYPTTYLGSPAPVTETQFFVCLWDGRIFELPNAFTGTSAFGLSGSWIDFDEDGVIHVDLQSVSFERLTLTGVPNAAYTNDSRVPPATLRHFQISLSNVATRPQSESWRQDATNIRSTFLQGAYLTGDSITTFEGSARPITSSSAKALSGFTLLEDDNQLFSFSRSDTSTAPILAAPTAWNLTGYQLSHPFEFAALSTLLPDVVYPASIEDLIPAVPYNPAGETFPIDFFDISLFASSIAQDDLLILPRPGGSAFELGRRLIQLPFTVSPPQLQPNPGLATEFLAITALPTSPVPSLPAP